LAITNYLSVFKNLHIGTKVLYISIQLANFNTSIMLCLKQPDNGQSVLKYKKLSLTMPGRHTAEEVAQLYSFLISAVDTGQQSISLPSHITPGKGTHYPFNRRLDRPQSQSGQFLQRENLL
jgi:hypothetical protein